MVLYKDKEEPEKIEKEEKTAEERPSVSREKILKNVKLLSPIKGKAIELENVKDDAFASGILGKGVAVLPEEGKVYAPADGEISALFPTLHAIGMTTDSGAQLLIHIGLDTVQLEGEGFEAFVKQGDHVKQGDLLVSFDQEFIEGKGYCLETPILVTNVEDFLDVVQMGSGQIHAGDELLELVK